MLESWRNPAAGLCVSKLPGPFLAHPVSADFAGQGLQRTSFHHSHPGVLEKGQKVGKSTAAPQVLGGDTQTHQKMSCRKRGKQQEGQAAHSAENPPPQPQQGNTLQADKEFWNTGSQHGETPTNHVSRQGFHPSCK